MHCQRAFETLHIFSIPPPLSGEHGTNFPVWHILYTAPPVSSDRDNDREKAGASADSVLRCCPESFFRLNRGFPFVTGEFLIWPDGDDVLEQESVKKRVEFLQEHPEYRCVRSLGYYVLEEYFSSIPYRILAFAHSTSRFSLTSVMPQISARQDYQNIEVILVDDGSPDHCPAVCEDYAGKYKNIQVIHQENQGAGAARNRGKIFPNTDPCVRHILQTVFVPVCGRTIRGTV